MLREKKITKKRSRRTKNFQDKNSTYVISL
jgi:hypothetical protein